ncbi:hypothetical protein SARC_16825, partial [Sphaeroforma arctica JP610]
MGQFITHHHEPIYIHDEFDTKNDDDEKQTFESTDSEMTVESVGKLSSGFIRKISIQESQERFLQDK